MKIMKLASIATVALATFAAQFTARGEVAQGDIYSIDLNAGGVYGGLIPSEDKPLVAGESQKAVIRVRLLNHDYAAASVEPTKDTVKKWRFMPTTPWLDLDDPGKTAFAPGLGIMLGASKQFAEYLGTEDVVLPGMKQPTYTDIYFSYVPKAGDLAMPALFMNAEGKPASSEISVDYFLNNVAYWQLTCDDGSVCNFHFGPDSYMPDPDPSFNPNRCISGLGLGLYIKTVDLDKNYDVPAETIGGIDIWRQIHRGATTTAKANGLPSVTIEGGAPAELSTTVYAWVPANELDIASPLSTEAVKYTDTYRLTPGGEQITETRYVLSVSIPQGGSSRTFRIKGVSNGFAHVRMSSSPELLIDDAGVLIPNWVERTIEVVDPPSPFVSFEMQDPAGTPLTTPVNCSADYKNYVAKMVVTLSQAPTAKVTVKINPTIKGGDDIFGDTLLAISTTTEGTPWTDEIDSVSFDAGETEKVLYIYAKGSSKNLADYGVKFTPSTEGPGSEMFKDDDHSHTASLVVKYMQPVVVQPTAEQPIVGAMAGQPYSLDIAVSDAFKFMRETYTFKYKIKMNGAGSAASWETIDDVEVDADSGEATVDIDFEDEGEGEIEIYVLNADGQNSKHVNVPITVSGPKKAWAELDHADGQYAEGETARVKVKIDPKAPGSKALYPFLVPVNDDATNKFASTGFGLPDATCDSPISPGAADTGVNYIEVQVLDGKASAQYDVWICTQPQYNKSKSAGYSAGRLIINATNICPVVKSASMGGTDITRSGMTVAKSVAQGVNKKFRVSIGTSEPSQLDLDGELVKDEEGKVIADNRFCTQWKFGDADWESVYGNPDNSTNFIEHAFYSPGDQVVKVRVQDKDMRALNRWSEEFTFTIKVLDAPTVIISPRNGTSYSETDTGDVLSRFDVSLSCAPDFAGSQDRLVVELAVSLIGDASKYDTGDCVLSKTQIEFRSGVDNAALNSAAHYFFLRALDGTAESAASGFRITATVTPESQALDVEGKTWDPAEIEITVKNSKPEIFSPEQMFDGEDKPIAQSTTVGESLSLAWSIGDVVADKEGMTVTWTTSEGKRKVYKQGTGPDELADVMSGTHTFTFNSTGDKSVTMTVQDKDGGTTSTTIYYTIATSKTLQMVPHGPPNGNGTALSARYHDRAAGLGAGRVWASNLAQIENWVHKCNCGLASDWRIFASGYKVGEEDPAVNAQGNERGGGAGYKYTDDKKDSFLYAWLQLVQEQDSAKPTDEYLAVVPEHRNSANSGTLVNLAAEKDDDENFPATSVEAIFSKEWLASDNMGDINQDGIPDIYIKKYDFEIFDAEGNAAGDDLKPISVANENGNTDEDYLPSFGTSKYGTLIPGLKTSWVTSGKPFDAKTEIRGYHNGLNDAAALVGIAGVESDRIYAEEVGGAWKWTDNCTISEVEFAAWCEWAAANLGPDAWKVSSNWKLWSPERPTDPCAKDTDDDGIDDGYEYYFWYRAHVGYVENNVHKYLTGHAYDPKNPGEGKFLSSAYIARMMDPRSDLKAVDNPMGYTVDNSNADTRDSDNDGLPDLLEFEIGTNPFEFDTDGDGLPDGWEIIMAGSNPLLATTYNHGIDDASRNFDGDAMAISSYKLEKNVQPAQLNTEHARRWTFAVASANGDTDGVQWYATVDSPWTVIKPDEEKAIKQGSWWKVTVDGVAYCIGEEPTLVNGRLAKTYDNAYTITSYEPPAEPEPEEGGEEEVFEATLAEDDGEEPAAPTTIPARGYKVMLMAGSYASVEEGDSDLAVLVVSEAIEAKQANACWIYGKGAKNARIGEVADSAADYGCLALGRQLEVPANSEVYVMPSDERDVAFLHYLCYQEFGFDPRTAWSASEPVAPRWGKGGGYVGKPARTRAFTAYDEFLLYSFFLNNGTAMTGRIGYRSDSPKNNLAEAWALFTTNPMGPGETIDGEGPEDTGYYFGRDSDQGADTDGDGVPDGWELYVMAGPKTDEGDFVFAPAYAGFATAKNPFVVMPSSYLSPFVAAAAKAETSNDTYLGGASNNDGLNELREFAGTDSVAHYANYSTTIVRPAADEKWLNKFLPTDPWSKDTDGDGLADNVEGSNFIYGTPADGSVNGNLLKCIPGGGLNPCSVDTDLDGLPDAWEWQFKGRASSLYKADNADFAKDSEGNEVGNALQGLTDGMDGTVADAMTSPSTTVINGVKQLVNRDYDHDGLENWQEYLTGTMRCWRYDDPASPMTYIPREFYYTTNDEGKEEFSVEYAIETLRQNGFIESEDDTEAVGEFWYKTLVDTTSAIYNPHLISGTAAGSQYFSKVVNGWDYAYLDALLDPKHPSGAYYWFYDKIDGLSLTKAWGNLWKSVLDENFSGTLVIAPGKYPSCSPIDADSDRDGMDDYYEVFHGMNPLLGVNGAHGVWVSQNGSGAIAGGSSGLDLIHDSMYVDGYCIPQAFGSGDEPGSFKNYWQRKYEIDGVEFRGRTPGDGTNSFDFVYFPWLNGIATADPDGDGTMNQEESIMGLVAPLSAWHHSDPTPLWMTDSSYSNSLTRIAYRMPVRSKMIELDKSMMVEDSFGEQVLGFTYQGMMFYFNAFPGYLEVDEGFGDIHYYLAAYTPDQWSLAGSEDDMNFIASFEENEGYDTDHDGFSDKDEVEGKYHGKTDPADFDSPRRRQAMYFQGEEKPSALQTMPVVREEHPLSGGSYPDEMAFMHYTVECWVKAEEVTDSTIIERTSWIGESHPADEEYMRCNFQIGIKDGKWYTKYDPNDTTKSTVEVFSAIPASTEWTHLAATYDGNQLILFVNGDANGRQASGLQPAYGASAAWVRGPISLVDEGAAQTFSRDAEYQLNAIIIGASAKTCKDDPKITTGGALDVTRGSGWDGYTRFFKGYVDEVRVWDGARSIAEIKSDVMTRYTAEMAMQNRETFFNEWAKGGVSDRYRGRYAKDESGNPYPVPAELRYHWSFDSVFGAVSADQVAVAPNGYNYNDNGDYEPKVANQARALLSRPAGYEIAWWKKIVESYDSVYAGKTNWVTWIPNTVAHLPRFDGTTLDSFYWSDDFKGDQLGTYTFAHAAEPVSLWTQFTLGGLSGSSLGYKSASTRHFLATEMDDAKGTSLELLHTFTARHLNQVGDDMLPLGGAYVKQSETMWDGQGASANWEVNAGNADSVDGLPAWWTSYAEDVYFAKEGEELTWNTTVLWPEENGAPMTAGEAYLRDLARGYVSNEDGSYAVTDGSAGDFTQTSDMNGMGIPDWWSELYGLKGVNPLDDSDNDGLPNYVEYLLSEVFEFQGVTFSPINPQSADPFVLDYFYKVGELYVGEIFTDHDLVDDFWEDLYDDSFSTRLLWDADQDADQDGWSNRSEVRYSKQCMPTQADKQTHYSASDGLVADYPIPTIALTLKYNEARKTEVAAAPIIVKMTTDETLSGDFDATFEIAGVAETKADTGTSSWGGGSSDDKNAGEAKTRTLGKWSNRHALGTLTPGYINKDSVALEFCFDPSSQVYSWTVLGDALIKRGTRAAYDADRRKFGDANVKLLSRSTEYSELEAVQLRTAENSSLATWMTQDGQEIGTLDLTTGAFDINLGVFAGQYFTNTTNANDYVSAEDQTFRIAYSVNNPTDLPRKLYLGEATTGHVREGLNKIIAWADLNGDGDYTPGEPFGCVAGVDVSWKGVSAEIELTETSVISPRMNIATGESDREVVWGTDSGYWTNLVAGVLNGGTKTRVRVVRTIYNSDLVSILTQIGIQKEVASRVVLDKEIDLNAWPVITEADFLSSDNFDIDWNTLYADILSPGGKQLQDLSKVYYRVVLGSGSVDVTKENNLYQVMFSRAFDPATNRTLAMNLQPGDQGNQEVVSASPTFKWSMNGFNTYTAFRIQVNDASGALVYDSGFQGAPQSANTTYEWTSPDLKVGDLMSTGKVFENKAYYTWKVSMYNSKYMTDAYATGGKFFMNVQENGMYGKADVAVKYYGPADTYKGKTIRVKAYTSPDFTGKPVASGYVADPDDADSGVEVAGKPAKANCQILGIPKGSYYLKAFIDSNGNGVCDKWESMGYLCNRTGASADWLDPVAIKFGEKRGQSDLAVIYIEDADTDGDSLPDAWEFAKYGNLTTKGVESAKVTEAGESLIAKELADALTKRANAGAEASGIAGRILYSINSSRTLAALISGVDEANLEPKVTMTVTGLNFNQATGKVEISFSADVEEISNAIYTIRVGEVVRIQLYHTDTLAGDWKPVYDAPKAFTVNAAAQGETLEVPMGDIDLKAGFFKVEFVK